MNQLLIKRFTRRDGLASLIVPLAALLTAAYSWDLENPWGLIKLVRTAGEPDLIPWMLIRTLLWALLLFGSGWGFSAYLWSRQVGCGWPAGLRIQACCFIPFLWLIPAFAIQYAVRDLSFIKWLFYFPRLVLIGLSGWAGIKILTGLAGQSPLLSLEGSARPAEAGISDRQPRPAPSGAAKIKPAWIVGLAIGLFTIAWTVLLADKFEAVCLGRELGVFSQAFWNTLHGRFMAYSKHGVMNNLLSDYHVSPLLILLTPLYALWQDPRALLAGQALLVGLGAWPLFLLARSVCASHFTGLVFALAYLVFAPLHYALQFDLRTATLVPVLVLWAFYTLYERRYRNFGLALILLLACREDTFLYAIGLGVYALVTRRDKSVAWATMGLGLLWGVFIILWIMHCNQDAHCDSPYRLRYVRYLQLGQNPAEILQTVFLQPAQLFRQIWALDHRRALVTLSLPLGFLPVFGGVGLIPLLLPGLEWLWSNGWYIFHFENHYFAVLAPGLFISGVFGVQRLACWLVRLGRRWPVSGPGGMQQRLTVLLLASSAVMSATNPYAAFPWPGRFVDTLQAYRPSLREQIRIRLAGQIPPTASVSSNRYTCFAGREWAFAFPTIGHADYLFIDLEAGVDEMPEAQFQAYLAQARADTRYRLLVEEQGFLLLKRRREGDK